MNRQKMIGALCGTVLGDAYIDFSNKKSKNAHLRLAHCKRQEGYLDYKIEIFSEICKMGKADRNYPSHKNMVHSWSRCHPLITQMHKWFYGSGKKKVTDKILYHLTPLGLALWYMDDGYLGYIKKKGKIRGREVKLYTCGFSYEEHKKMVKYFLDKWDIKWRIGRAKVNGKECYHLATGAKEGIKFFDIIAPYIPDCMSYKVDMKYVYSSYAGRPLRSVIQSELGSNVKIATEMIATQ